MELLGIVVGIVGLVAAIILAREVNALQSRVTALDSIQHDWVVILSEIQSVKEESLKKYDQAIGLFHQLEGLLLEAKQVAASQVTSEEERQQELLRKEYERIDNDF